MTSQKAGWSCAFFQFVRGEQLNGTVLPVPFSSARPACGEKRYVWPLYGFRKRTGRWAAVLALAARQREVNEFRAPETDAWL
jgi:hypothetical protein